MKKTQTKFWFYIVAVLIPVLFFVLLELSLRIFNYGYDNREWVPITKDELILNPNIAKRYFNVVKSLPYSIQDVFDKKKKKGAFRVFVLGGSSAAGYPYMPLGSFSRYLQQRYEMIYPQTKIEIINIAMTAVNTYTIRDLLPGVLEQKPDAILIYAGHNEFYGALGVGSMESLGKSRTVVNLLLYLRKFKTFELLSDVINAIGKIFSSGKSNLSHGTLMSRMAKNKFIPLNSQTFNAGVEQFEGNLSDILEEIHEAKVPVVIGTLVSNYKDQKPFVSKKVGDLPSANEIYGNALKEYDAGSYNKADSLFKYAKDLDMLRFRAPEVFNNVIRKLSKKYGAKLISFDSLFAANSPHGIVGNNLITDHLHPTLHGYQLMGDAFARALLGMKIHPHGLMIKYPLKARHLFTVKYFKFSKLDSVIAKYRIKLLKNDYPYINPKDKKPLSILIRPKDIVDSVAFDFLMNEFTWEKAHRILADYYLAKGEVNKFLKYMDILITQYPIIKSYYPMVTKVLLEHHRYDDSYRYFKKYHEIAPNAYNTKWMGIIALSHKNWKEAIVDLNESLKYNDDDPQVLYNLAGAYVMKKDYRTAKELTVKALSINPNYIDAKNLLGELNRALRK